MLDKTITSALLNLRAQIIRGKLDGLEHVNALLVALGVDPAAQYVAGKAKPAFRRSELRQIIFAALRLRFYFNVWKSSGRERLGFEAYGFGDWPTERESSLPRILSSFASCPSSRWA